MISLDGAQLLQQWDLFRMETDHSNQQNGFHFTLSVEETGYCFEEGCHDVLRSTKRCPTKRQKAKCSCFDRSCCPLAVIDPNISAPRTKIDPKKTTRQNRTQKGAPCNEIRPKIGAPHTVHQNRAQKRRATRQKRPQKGTPCTEIGPKIGAAHQNRTQKRRTAHQNRAQKRRTVHRNRPQNRRTTYRAPKSTSKTAQCTPKPPEKAHLAPKSTRKGIMRQDQDPIFDRSRARFPPGPLKFWCTEIDPKIGAPRTKSEPKNDAPCTEIGPKIGAPHTKIQPKNGAPRTKI